MFSYIPLGYDCSAAGALLDLGLRREAYPFDWVQSGGGAIRQCILEGFTRYHTDVRLMEHGRRVIDAYGIQYPHDYPVREAISPAGAISEAASPAVEEKTVEVVEVMGEAGNEAGMYMEEMSRPIVAEWELYRNTVQEKYQRRVQRFLTALANRDQPVIFFTRYHDGDARELLRWLRVHYQRDDLYMVNTGQPESGGVVDGCVTIYAERNGIWNETAVWREGLDALLRQ